MNLTLPFAGNTGSVSSTSHDCPQCHIKLIYRARRNFLVKLFLPWLPVKRYKCYACSKKYYVFKKSDRNTPPLNNNGNIHNSNKPTLTLINFNG